MRGFPQNHPFAVKAFFDYSAVLTYAVRPNEVKHLVPQCFSLDLFRDEWAFLAAAVVRTREMRPAGFPKWLGREFFLIGYRVFVNHISSSGRKLRGLYILRSDTDKYFMQLSGNLFTHYKYRTVDVTVERSPEMLLVKSLGSGLDVQLRIDEEEKTPLPPDSPFCDWREARRFSGPMPFTFTYLKNINSTLTVEGKRQTWKPKPITVLREKISYFQELNLSECRLANAFIVEKVPYQWTRGKLEGLPK